MFATAIFADGPRPLAVKPAPEIAVGSIGSGGSPTLSTRTLNRRSPHSRDRAADPRGFARDVDAGVERAQLATIRPGSVVHESVRLGDADCGTFSGGAAPESDWRITPPVEDSVPVAVAVRAKLHARSTKPAVRDGEIQVIGQLPRARRTLIKTTRSVG